MLSPINRSIAEREKRVFYQNLNSLQVYLSIEQERAELRLPRRAERKRRGEPWLRYGNTIDLQSLAVEQVQANRFERAWP